MPDPSPIDALRASLALDRPPTRLPGGLRQPICAACGVIQDSVATPMKKVGEFLFHSKDVSEPCALLADAAAEALNVAATSYGPQEAYLDAIRYDPDARVIQAPMAEYYGEEAMRARQVMSIAAGKLATPEEVTEAKTDPLYEDGERVGIRNENDSHWIEHWARVAGEPRWTGGRWLYALRIEGARGINTGWPESRLMSQDEREKASIKDRVDGFDDDEISGDEPEWHENEDVKTTLEKQREDAKRNAREDAMRWGQTDDEGEDEPEVQWTRYEDATEIWDADEGLVQLLAGGLAERCHYHYRPASWGLAYTLLGLGWEEPEIISVRGAQCLAITLDLPNLHDGNEDPTRWIREMEVTSIMVQAEQAIEGHRALQGDLAAARMVKGTLFEIVQPLVGVALGNRKRKDAEVQEALRRWNGLIAPEDRDHLDER